MDNLLKAYRDRNITTLQELSQEMDVSMFEAMKAYEEALERGLVSNNLLAYLGRMVADNLDDEFIRDFLNHPLDSKSGSFWIGLAI